MVTYCCRGLPPFPHRPKNRIAFAEDGNIFVKSCGNHRESSSPTSVTTPWRPITTIPLGRFCGLDLIQPLQILGQQFVGGHVLIALLIAGDFLPINPGAKVIYIVAE